MRVFKCSVPVLLILSLAIVCLNRTTIAATKSSSSTSTPSTTVKSSTSTPIKTTTTPKPAAAGPPTTKTTEETVSSVEIQWNVASDQVWQTLLAGYQSKLYIQKGNGYFGPANMSEDCLSLNVFTSNTSSSAKLPVMLWIHGGSFTSGGSPEYVPEAIAWNLASRQVVIVTINYRLNVFGFLNSGTDTKEIPGNLGLWDQLFALKWVQKNIVNFGGDRTKVTIFGESAGAAAVSLLTYSPIASNNSQYFRSAIMQSGTGQDVWAVQNGYRYPTSQHVAVNSTCKSKSDWTNGKLGGLADCLRKLPAANLTALGYGYAFAPVIDGDGGLLPSNMSVLAKQRNPNISVIVGTNNDEGAFWFISLLARGLLNVSSAGLRTFDEQLDERINPGVFGVQGSKILKSTLEYVYTRDLKPADHLKWLHATSKFNTDSLFKSGAVHEAMLWQSVNSSNIFTYSFNYLPVTFPWPGNPVYKGVFHSMDLTFVFPNPMDAVKFLFGPSATWTFDAADNRTVDLFGKAWTNFAKSGDPNKPDPLPATWNAFSLAKNSQYFAINNVSMTENDYNQQAGDLWLKLVPELVANANVKPSPQPTPKPPVNYSVGLAYFIATWILLSLLCICIAVGLFLMVRTLRNEDRF